MRKILVIILLYLLICQSCTISYKLSGASIAPDVKTISVQYFINRAPLGTSAIEQYFTNELKDKFKSQTNLTVVNEMGHLNFEGEITQYNPHQPLAITGDEQAAQNRFTITVHVKFTNEIEPQYNFDENFTQYTDYNSDEDFNSIEQQEIEKVVEKLVEDIFNRAVVNW